MPNSRGTYQHADGHWVTSLGFPLRVINLEYLGASSDFPERALRVFYNDGYVITINKDGVAGLMEHAEMAPYSDSLGNLVLNEAEYWFDDKDPFLTTKLLL